jgi:GNAT superfamily N-acetyltransferase
MRAEILPFAEEHLSAAGRLLAERHRRHRDASPLLSPRFEDVATAEAEVTAAWRSEDASGAVAVRDGAVMAYLLGAPKSASQWGPNVWVETAGQACGAAAGDAELMRDVYALAATRWIAEGRTAQYVLVPSYDAALVDAWFRLGFGQQHAHAVRPSSVTPRPLAAGLRLREPRREDIATLARLELALPEHQGSSPVFSAGQVPTLEESIAEWEEDWGDPAFFVVVAEVDGQVVGHAVGCAATIGSTNLGLTRPDEAGFLGFAAVLPEARGHGAGRALGEAVIAWSAEAGYPSIITDWRQTNLLSSRTWPALGWKTTFLRLHRSIGY